MALKSKVTFVKIKGLVFRVDLRAGVSFQSIKIADIILQYLKVVVLNEYYVFTN